MKNFYLLTKTLLVAVGLLVGTSAWAVDYTSTSTNDGVTTTTINFYTYAFAKYAFRSSGTLNYTSNSVTTTNSQTLYLVQDYSDFTFYNYLALPNNDANVVLRRGSSGSSASSTNEGLFAGGRKRYYMSLTNLHVGDVITFTVNTGSANLQFTSSNATYLVESTPTAVKGGTTNATSGTEYTITSGTQLDMYFGADANQNDYIGIITIKSQYDAVSNPSIAITAQSGTSTTARITAGISTSGSTVTTYYTTDGRTPTPADNDGSFTTATKDVVFTSSNTLKAISVTSGTFGGSSYVVSEDIEVAPETLVAPTLTVTAITKVGDVYYPTYSFSSDQSSLNTVPDAGDLTYTYTFAGGSPATGTEYAATSAGTLSVTVSAEGYTTSTATEVNIVSLDKTYAFDGSKIYDHSDNGSGGDGTANGVGQHYYSTAGMVLNGITISGLAHAWAITAGNSTGFLGRTSSGSVTYNGSFPEGSFMRYYNLVWGGSGSWSVANSNTVNFNQYGGFTTIEIYVPSASATAYSIASGTNLTNNGTFDSNITGWDTKGTITKEGDSSTSGSGFGYNASGWAEMWADNNSASADYAHYNSDCYIAQRYVNIPAGNYCVTADLVANGGNVSAFTISVNGEVKQTANGYFDDWTTKTYVVNVPSDGGCITIKYCPENGGRAWVGIDNVSCVYGFNNVSKTISAAGWATYCSPYPLDFSSSIANLKKAYLVTGATGNTLDLAEITGTVPANTGILLEGEGVVTEVPVTIPVVASSSTDVSANKLVGVTTNTPIDAEAGYVLMGSPRVGFYKNSNDFTVGANTAYLPADFAGARMAFFGFDDEATGVQNLTPALSEGEGVVYNLRGQRVAQPTKGLYIVNGKKVVIK